jgi:pimeloyl-ACP methyl ester carboxylesterase
MEFRPARASADPTLGHGFLITGAVRDQAGKRADRLQAVCVITSARREEARVPQRFSCPRTHCHEDWAPGPIDLDDETESFFLDYWGAVAPDGPEHFSVVKAKLDRMHREEPTLTVACLAGYPGPVLVMVGDSDEEIPMEHTLALREGLPDAQLAVLPGTGHGGLDTRIVIHFLTHREEEA